MSEETIKQAWRDSHFADDYPIGKRFEEFKSGYACAACVLVHCTAIAHGRELNPKCGHLMANVVRRAHKHTEHCPGDCEVYIEVCLTCEAVAKVVDERLMECGHRRLDWIVCDGCGGDGRECTKCHGFKGWCLTCEAVAKAREDALAEAQAIVDRCVSPIDISVEMRRLRGAK